MALKTERKYEEPRAIQFSVFLANRVGQLEDMLLLLGRESVSLLGISIVDSADWAVNRLVFADHDKAREILRKCSIPFTESEVLLVELAAGKTLADVCGHLVRAEVNVHFAYPLMIRWQNNPIMVFHVDDISMATRALSLHNLALLNDYDLADMP